jgi:transposase
MRTEPPLRPSRADAYVPFIRETLAKFPTLTASRLHAMVRERGYAGGADHFRHIVACHRPRPAGEAYLRFRTLPGEQAQVDWGHFGHLMVGRAKRPLMAFVMVLSYSRRIFLRFSLNARMDSFLHGHVEAFAAFACVARVPLYDNLKSAALERVGDAIRFHPELLAFAAHPHYEPRPVAVARGNEKGRVERSIRHIRDSFFAARSFTDVDDLNAQARAWCECLASDRPWPEDRCLSVREAFETERASLMALPEHAYPVGERVAVQVGKTPYVRFDLNDYSIPHTHVRRTFTVVADPARVRVLDGVTVLASHRRSYACGAQIDDVAHIRRWSIATRSTTAPRRRPAGPCRAGGHAAAASRRRARPQPGLDHGGLVEAARSLRRAVAAAVIEALTRDVPHPNAVRLVLERAREQRHELPPVVAQLSERARSMDVTVRPHGVETYDELRRSSDATP